MVHRLNAAADDMRRARTAGDESTATLVEVECDTLMWVIAQIDAEPSGQSEEGPGEL